jgi:hypothetical protein
VHYAYANSNCNARWNGYTDTLRHPSGDANGSASDTDSERYRDAYIYADSNFDAANNAGAHCHCDSDAYSDRRGDAVPHGHSYSYGNASATNADSGDVTDAKSGFTVHQYLDANAGPNR